MQEGGGLLGVVVVAGKFHDDVVLAEEVLWGHVFGVAGSLAAHLHLIGECGLARWRHRHIVWLSWRRLW